MRFMPRVGTGEEVNATCSSIILVADRLKCDFVKATNDCDRDQLLHAHYLLYCLMDNSFFAPFVLMLLIVILFSIVGVISDDFICPLMAALASLLNLSESVAGVTILALGNGTPDLMSAMTSLEQGAPETMFCNLVGGGLIDTTLIVGTIIFVERFKFQPVSLLRDCGFYLFSMIMFFLFYLQKTWTLWHSFFFIVVYIVYAAVVLARYFYDLAIMRAAENETPNPKDLIIQRASLFSQHIEEEKLNVHKELKTLSIDLWQLLKPDPNEIAEKSLFSKIIFVALIPISFVLKLLIPQFNFTIENNGWSKSLYIVNVLFFPTLTVFSFNYSAVPEYLVQTTTMGVLFAVVVYTSSSRLKKPRYHNLVIFHVFFTSFALVNITVNSIINLLSAIASKFSFSKTSLPLTLLSFGNCIGDFVTNVNMARTGLPRMAIAACYAGPLFNLVFDAGFMVLYVFLVNEQTSMKVTYGEMGPLGILFLFIGLFITITVVPLLYYEARKSYAFFLFALYIEFVFLLILCEAGITYPIGEKAFIVVEDDPPYHDDHMDCNPLYGKCK